MKLKFKYLVLLISATLQLKSQTSSPSILKENNIKKVLTHVFDSTNSSGYLESIVLLNDSGHPTYIAHFDTKHDTVLQIFYSYNYKASTTMTRSIINGEESISTCTYTKINNNKNKSICVRNGQTSVIVTKQKRASRKRIVNGKLSYRYKIKRIDTKTHRTFNYPDGKKIKETLILDNHKNVVKSEAIHYNIYKESKTKTSFEERKFRLPYTYNSIRYTMEYKIEYFYNEDNLMIKSIHHKTPEFKYDNFTHLGNDWRTESYSYLKEK